MARLSDQEKKQLREAAERKTPRPPSMPVRPIEQLLAFNRFASQFKPASKPVRFVGDQWKL